ncbi:hypothetical protein L2E82_28688 [Cichorium intybus]|uniref:Uncharacterized protein n=1 Tax=Cichorium intybus TaxID=13427 RepID=A0ACB9CWS3_CICIN|nr:hypothetical protein L2E82_28688 [Cichorium intybus]
MDRTSILGDTIDYMKELLEKIHKLKEQDIESDVDLLKLVQVPSSVSETMECRVSQHLFLEKEEHGGLAKA